MSYSVRISGNGVLPDGENVLGVIQLSVRLSFFSDSLATPSLTRFLSPCRFLCVVLISCGSMRGFLEVLSLSLSLFSFVNHACLCLHPTPALSQSQLSILIQFYHSSIYYIYCTVIMELIRCFTFFYFELS